MRDSKHDSILDIVLARPWWVSLAIAAVAYAAWRFVPPLIAGNPQLADLASGIMRVAPPLSIMFAAVVPVALLSKLHRRRARKDDRSDPGETDPRRIAKPVPSHQLRHLRTRLRRTAHITAIIPSPQSCRAGTNDTGTVRTPMALDGDPNRRQIRRRRKNYQLARKDARNR